MQVSLFDDRGCELGEGPIWHPLRQQFFWFDIVGKKLLSRTDDEQLEWQFNEHVSAAGWINEQEFMIASETALFRFNVDTGERSHLVDLEADNPLTRSNDGRADPWGGFWIGTMGKGSEDNAGAIYRYYRGKLVKLYGDITVSNSICFSPDRQYAYYSNTPTSRIMRQKLDADGWPDGEPTVFVEITEANFWPDGSVVDADGCLWNAQWGGHRVAQYSPEGQLLQVIQYPAEEISCPAFGGPEMTTLYATSARIMLDPPRDPDGRTYVVETATRGQNEHQIIL